MRTDVAEGLSVWPAWFTPQLARRVARPPRTWVGDEFAQILASNATAGMPLPRLAVVHRGGGWCAGYRLGEWLLIRPCDTHAEATALTRLLAHEPTAPLRWPGWRLLCATEDQPTEHEATDCA